MLDKLNYGDIVTVADYAGYFRIIGKETTLLESEHEADEYDYAVTLECTHTGAGMYAFVEDITVVASRDEADGYLADKPAPFAGGIAVAFMPRFYGSPVGPPLTPKSKVTLEAERQAQIDALLDERITVGSSDDFVTVANMEAYKQCRYDEIDAQIKELTAE